MGHAAAARHPRDNAPHGALAVGDLSEHFSRREFLIDGRPNTTTDPPLELTWRLEDLRRRIGRPLPLLSWRRSAAHNRAVGGARRSWHLRGMAIDIPEGLVTLDQALASGFRGIGVRGSWVVHLDIRPSRSVVIFREG
jgi:uncharacterized protein YcbK (DUF882 family)